MALDTVLFDIGNVFVPWDPRFLYEKLIPDVDELDFFLSEVVTLEWHSAHDKGLPFQDGVAALCRKFPEYTTLIHAFNTRWEETIGAPFTGTVDALRLLAAHGVSLYALTNFSAEKWPAFAAQHNFTKFFQGVLVSGEEKLIKPDPRVFERAIDKFGLTPARTLFVDDRQDNIVASEKLGFVGHLFRAPELLTRDFHLHGLLPAHS